MQKLSLAHLLSIIILMIHLSNPLLLSFLILFIKEKISDDKITLNIGGIKVSLYLNKRILKL